MTSDGDVDQVLKRPVRYAHGFLLGWPGHPGAMGGQASPATFGYVGSGSTCSTWADPARGLVVAYLTSRVVGAQDGMRHQGQVSDALRAACT